MSGITNFFDLNYANAVKTIKDQYFEAFADAQSDYERISILYPHLNDIRIKDHDYGKDFRVAQESKEQGVVKFAKKQYGAALTSFNLGILKCPETTRDEAKFKSILIANRSATLYELKEYEKALKDVEYALSLKTYPVELSYKLYLRQINCYKQLRQDPRSVDELQKLAKQSLKYAKLETEVVKQKVAELQKSIQQLKKSQQVTSPTPTLLQTIQQNFRCNKNFKNASEELEFDYSEELGRFAKAKSDITPGSVIINEKSYCAVLEKKFWLSNCCHCMLATNVPVSCPKCANVVFCSVSCLQSSSSYHFYECGLHPTIASSGASINCYMSLRVITQHHLDYFKTENFDQSSHNNTEHYSVIYSLCRNEKMRKHEEYFHLTIMAVYLLKLLKVASYFKTVTDDLSEDEALIGSLIVRNLQILQFNAHEISELQESPPGPLDLPDEPAFKANYIGGGLYPTLALFNHSCDPGVVRFNIGSRMIVKTIKPIKRGEPIYENYGPIYTNVVLEKRRKFLLDRYWFTCCCKACEENWPTFENMADDVINLACKKCDGYVLLHKDVSDIAFNCNKCKANVNVMVHLKALSGLESILRQAEELYKQRQLAKATNLFLQALKIYFVHTRPPFPDWVKVQQRLRTCFVVDGNKCIDINNKTLQMC